MITQGKGTRSFSARVLEWPSDAYAIRYELPLRYTGVGHSIECGNSMTGGHTV